MSALLIVSFLVFESGQLSQILIQNASKNAIQKTGSGMVCLNGAPNTASASLNGKPPSSRDGAWRSKSRPPPISTLARPAQLFKVAVPTEVVFDIYAQNLSDKKTGQGNESLP
jgi:hypothetical protein